MPDIYLADATDYVVANSFEGAAETFADVRSKQAQTLTKTYDDAVVIMGLTDYTITTDIAGAATADGCFAYPASFTVMENSEVPISAIDGDTLAFTEWQDTNGLTLSTDNPYMITVIADTEVIGIFA